MSGPEQSVRAQVPTLDDASIGIAVDLADRPLTRSGADLINQSGHSASAHFFCSIATATPWHGPTRCG